jgi:glycosyltransferase involved in cell wall biosynthesis
MTDRPLASIVVNNYNYGRFIAQAIDSALQQTWPDVEVIVVDDGSTDDSRDVIAKYGQRITPIIQRNGGQASAVNAGYRASHGEIVLFLDADDLLDHDVVSAAVEKFAADPQVVQTQWPLVEIDRDGVPTGRLVPGLPLAEGDSLETVVRRGPYSHTTSPTSGNAWSRGYLEQVMPVADYGDRHGADAYLCLLAPVYGRIACLGEPHGFYRTHDLNFSGRAQLDRIRKNLLRYPMHSAILAEHLRRRGIEVATESWLESSWLHRLVKTLQEVDEHLPAGRPFILVDQNEWGSSYFPEQTVIPYTERAGEYWGAPEDNRTALEEFLRLHDAGAEYVVIGWPAFWWMEHYTSVSEWLEANGEAILSNDRVRIYRLPPRSEG